MLELLAIDKKSIFYFPPLYLWGYPGKASLALSPENKATSEFSCKIGKVPAPFGPSSRY